MKYTNNNAKDFTLKKLSYCDYDLIFDLTSKSLKGKFFMNLNKDGMLGKWLDNDKKNDGNILLEDITNEDSDSLREHLTFATYSEIRTAFANFINEYNYMKVLNICTETVFNEINQLRNAHYYREISFEQMSKSLKNYQDILNTFYEYEDELTNPDSNFGFDTFVVGDYS